MKQIVSPTIFKLRLKTLPTLRNLTKHYKMLKTVMKTVKESLTVCWSFLNGVVSFLFLLYHILTRGLDLHELQLFITVSNGAQIKHSVSQSDPALRPHLSLNTELATKVCPLNVISFATDTF